MAVIARDQVTIAVSVDVASVDTWYKVQASTATPPTKPTTASPSGWSTSEPGYDGTTTNTLYTCQCTTLTDGTFYWGAVCVSSSYEAAKQAANAAASANSREQVVYYRSKVSTAPSAPTAWVTATGNVYNDTATVGNAGWTRKVTPVASSTSSSADKYQYLFSCVQRQTVSQSSGTTCTNGDVLLEEYTTVIDGSLLVENSVTADHIQANTLHIGDMGDADDYYDKDEANQLAQPNLTPWFSSDVSDYTSSSAATTDHFWYSGNRANLGSITDMGDGWARIVVDNSSGSSAKRYDYAGAAAVGVECGKDYTFLFEFRNNASTTPSSGTTQVYVVQQGGSVSVQFWGGTIKKNLEGNGTGSSTALAKSSDAADFPAGTSGVYVKRFVKTSEASDSSYYARSGFKGLCTLVAYVAAGGKFDCEMRFSVYEGEYTGPWKPYSGSQLYASKSELRVQSDRIGMVVSNADASSSLQLTADAMSYIGGHVEITDEAGTSTVISGGKVVADNLRVKVANIDGTLTIGQLPDEAKNSNVQVGGRNLLCAEPQVESPSAYLAYTLRTVMPLVEIGAGSTITLQLWGVQLDSNSTGVGCYWGGSNAGDFLFEDKVPDANGYVRWTIDVTSEMVARATASKMFIQVYNKPNGHSGYSCSIERWKLEIGNAASAWSPAPEDVNPQPNLLRSTNQRMSVTPYDEANSNPSLGYWGNGLWRTSSGTSTSGGAEVVPIDDPPDPSQLHAFRVWSTTSGNKDVSQTNIPFEATLYLFSCWVRLTPGVTQSSAIAQMRIWGYASSSATSGSALKTSTLSVTSTEWVRFRFSFELTSAQTDRPAAFLLGSKGVGDLQFCGVKVEESVLTAWAPSQFDIASPVYVDDSVNGVSEALNTAVDELDGSMSLLADGLSDLSGDVSSLGTRVGDVERGMELAEKKTQWLTFDESASGGLIIGDTADSTRSFSFQKLSSTDQTFNFHDGYTGTNTTLMRLSATDGVDAPKVKAQRIELSDEWAITVSGGLFSIDYIGS